MDSVKAFLHDWRLVLLIIHVGVTAAMIVVILLQRSEGGGLANAIYGSVAMGVAAYRAGEARTAAEGREEDVGHRGQHGAGCWACKAALDWAEANPGRRPGDLLEAADRGLEARMPSRPEGE